MKKIGLLLVCAILLLSVATAQMDPIKSLDQPMPEYISTPYKNSWIGKYNTYQEYVLGSIRAGNTLGHQQRTRAWFAFSDRDNNVTYDAPNGNPVSSSICKPLRLMQKIYIAEFSDDGKWAKVFTADKVEYPQVYNAKVCGWIKVENLLLWHKCPASAQNILEKGLIVQDVTMLNQNNRNNQVITFLSEPRPDAKAENEAVQLEIPFIMKSVVENGVTYYLMSYHDEFKEDGNNQRNSILGWLSERDVTPWNQRLCLEPASENIDELVNQHLYPVAYEKLEEAQRFVATPSQMKGKELKSFSFKEGQRPNGNLMRSPILKDASNNIFQAVVIGAQNDEVVPLSPEEIARLRGQIIDYTNKLQSINVIFVLDATNSMKYCFDAVSNALQNIVKKTYSQRIQVGVVVYRNVADGKDEIAYQKVTDITDNLDEVRDFIRKTQCFSKGNGYHESFYKGLEYALDYRKLGYKQGESNFIIAIGDCGNVVDDANMKKLAALSKRIYEEKFSFFAYNVGFGDNPAYEDYQDQVLSILESTIDKGNSWVNSIDADTYGIFAKENGRRTNEPDKINFGGLRLASTRSVDANTITKAVTRTFMDYIAYNENVVAQLNEKLKGGTGPKGTGGWSQENYINFLCRHMNWTRQKAMEYIELDKASKISCWLPMRINTSTQSFYDYVLFFSEEELGKLVDALKEVNPTKDQGGKIYDNPTTRGQYQEAMKKLGMSFLGITDMKKIEDMSPDEVMNQVCGIPVKIKTSGRIERIGDITDGNKVSQKNFLRFAYAFSEKAQNLESIKVRPYAYSFRMTNNSLFYWIPFVEMPGYCTDED